MNANDELTNDLKKAGLKAFEVENHSGGLAEPMTFDDACTTARQMSIADSAVYWVRRTYDYTPEVIFFCGSRYEPTAG
jgi:hypothetical protein